MLVQRQQQCAGAVLLIMDAASVEAAKACQPAQYYNAALICPPQLHCVSLRGGFDAYSKHEFNIQQRCKHRLDAETLEEGI